MSPPSTWPAEITANAAWLSVADLAADSHRSSAVFNLLTILAAARALHGPVLATKDDAEIIAVARAAILLLRGMPLDRESLAGMRDDRPGTT